jgi:CHAT domain-containing protein/tetratricopeptide (TPR) repeat protein
MRKMSLLLFLVLLLCSFSARLETLHLPEDCLAILAADDSRRPSDEGFESGDLQTWSWSPSLGTPGWTVAQGTRYSGRYSARAGRALALHDPGNSFMTSKLWINLQVREGYVRFYAQVKAGQTLWFSVSEPLSERMWYSGNDTITKKVLAASGWQEVRVWVPSGYWHFQWENRNTRANSIWIDDITFAETSHSLQALKEQADELLQMGTAGADGAEYEAAVESLIAASDLYRDIGNPRGEAKCLEVSGRAYSHHGYAYRAIELYRQSLALQQSFFDRPGMTKSLTRTSLARVQYALGSAYIGLGAYDLAIEHLDQSLAIWEAMLEGNLTTDALADLLYGASGKLATCLRILAAAYLWAEKREQALVYLEMALEISKRIDSTHGEIASLLGLADYSLGEGEHSQAHDYAQEAIGLVGTLDDRLLESACLLQLGLCSEALLQHEEAIANYRQALELSESIGDRDGILSAQWSLGRVHRKIGQLDLARRFYEHAIAALEESRSEIEEETLRASFFSTFLILYEEYLELQLELGETDDAMWVAERCRARTFLDLVAAGPVGTLDSIAEEGIRTGVVDASVIKSNLAEVVADLPANTAALEYFVTGGATYLWLVRDGLASDPIRIGSSRAELRKQVLAFRTTIETTSTKMSETPDPEEGMETVSRDLYELLIAPVEDQLEGIEHLVIVPSGPLYYLPFCALIDCPSCEGPAFCSGEYLVERYTLSYIPSLTTLKYAWAAADEVRDDPLFLALADPDSGDARFPRLVSMQHEAIAVAGLFDPSELHVATAATEEVVMARASEADQILLSTHGSFNPYNPMFSYLLLSPTDDNDGRLYTHEIFSLDLHTSLVTLSACETLLPALAEMEEDVRAVRGTPAEEDVELTDDLLETLTAGDEIVGLTRAFLYAGTPSVLSSLWSVVSETTEPLMVAFYGYLKAGLSKADALRQAQLDVMASYPHPRYWAAFSLVGDWR